MQSRIVMFSLHIIVAKRIHYKILLRYIVNSKNAGLNTTQCWVKYGQTRQLSCFDPEVVCNENLIS